MYINSTVFACAVYVEDNLGKVQEKLLHLLSSSDQNTQGVGALSYYAQIHLHQNH